MTVCDTAHTTTPQRAVNRVAAWDNQTIMQLIVIKYFNGTYCENQGIEGDVLSNDWLQENVTSSSFQGLHHVWVLFCISPLLHSCALLPVLLQAPPLKSRGPVLLCSPPLWLAATPEMCCTCVLSVTSLLGLLDEVHLENTYYYIYTHI